MKKQYKDDEPKSARYGKDLALQRAENQVHRSMGGDEHPSLTKYRKKNVEDAHTTYEHGKDGEDKDGWNPAAGPVTKEMQMPEPKTTANLHKYLTQHGLSSAEYMGAAGSKWDAVKTPLEGRDSMTGDEKTGDHDEDDYIQNDQKSINDRGRARVGSY